MPFHWNMDPIITKLGPIELRWYGIFFATGILLAVWQLARVLPRRGFTEDDANSISIWMIVFMIVGAHLVHLVFYDTHTITRLFDNPWSKDNWIPIIDVRSGLASHGGGIGAILSVWFFARSRGYRFFELVDACMASVVWVFPWVRIGNFFNSEIYGRPTDGPTAVVFERISSTPVHPSQLYEATLGFLLIGITVWLDRKMYKRLRPGALFFISLGLYFLWRFLVEYFKAYQTLSPNFPLTMGQCLSLPIICVCAGFLIFSKRHGLRTPPAPDQRWWEREAAGAEPDPSAES